MQQHSSNNNGWSRPGPLPSVSTILSAAATAPEHHHNLTLPPVGHLLAASRPPRRQPPPPTSPNKPARVHGASKPSSSSMRRSARTSRLVEPTPDLNAHITPSSLYYCNFCPSKFVTREARRQHNRVSHQKPYDCATCSSCFTRRFDLEKHILTVHHRIRPYACGECPSAFGQKHHLGRHVRAVHLKHKSFTCSQCGAHFTRREHHINHMRSLHAS